MNGRDPVEQASPVHASPAHRPPLRWPLSSETRRALVRPARRPLADEHELPETSTLNLVRRLARTQVLHELSGPAEAVRGEPDLVSALVLRATDRFGMLPFGLLELVVPGVSPKQRAAVVTSMHSRGWITLRRCRGEGLAGRPIDLLALTYDGHLSLRRLNRGAESPAERWANEWTPVELRRGSRAHEARPGRYASHHIAAAASALAVGLSAHAVTTSWLRTPRSDAGRLLVPPHRWTPTSRVDRGADVYLPGGAAVAWAGEAVNITPDAMVEIEIVSRRYDVLVEYQSAYGKTDEKLRAYDAMLTGWCLEIERYRNGAWPLVLFVFQTRRDARRAAESADGLLTGGITVPGLRPEHAYRPSREHLFFATAADLYAGDDRALALPPLPPQARAIKQPTITTVQLMPDELRCQCGICLRRARSRAA